MSGPDPNAQVAFVAAGPGSFVIDALTVLDTLPQSLPAWALVGGVSVAVNLAGFHRPTGDLDTVSLDGDTAVALLVARGASASRNGVTIAAATSDVGVDIIDVSEGDPGTGAFLAHRFGLDTAVRRTLQIVDPTGNVLLETTVPVATPSAIVAMKLHSIVERRVSRPEKRSGDVYDIVRLLAAFGASSVARTLRSEAPKVLLVSAATNCRQYFIEEVDRSYRWLRMDSRSVVSNVDRADVTAVGELARLLDEPLSNPYKSI